MQDGESTGSTVATAHDWTVWESHAMSDPRRQTQLNFRRKADTVEFPQTSTNSERHSHFSTCRACGSESHLAACLQINPPLLLGGSMHKETPNCTKLTSAAKGSLQTAPQKLAAGPGLGRGRMS